MAIQRGGYAGGGMQLHKLKSVEMMWVVNLELLSQRVMLLRCKSIDCAQYTTAL